MTKLKVGMISLGCNKNRVDSETALGLLREHGYELTNDPAQADVLMVNTCGFIASAKEESIDAILDMARYKQIGKCRALVVTGCLAQRYEKDLMQEIPEIDLLMGVNQYQQLPDALEKALGGVRKSYCMDDHTYYAHDRVLTTPSYTAYTRIGEGCSNCCTFCAIPKIRGPYRSRPEADILREIESLAKQGVKEHILVAQDTSRYGMDFGGGSKLAELMQKAAKIDGVDWLRVLYCYPEEIYDELIQTMKEEKKICHYLDLPIQHASDRILKRMGRRTTQAELVEIVNKLRREIPDIVLRTTLISGFPGETQEDHEELMSFVDEMEFDRLGVFTYSPEEDTPAATMPDQVAEEVKEARRDEIMELQQEISYDKGTDRIGQELLVMIEGKVADESAYIGRTYGDAPKVDGYIFVQTGELLMTGDFAKVRVTGALEYDLIGELADEYTE